MIQLSKNYEPALIEEKWNRHWREKDYFKSTPDKRKPFTIVIPPPNVTGVLHMGHTLNETVQDILVRRARMQGFNACWVPGSDHASIATEAKVVEMLKEKGISKQSISREAFLQHAYAWKEKYGGIIYSQIEKLGCSVDWSRVAFTMDEDYYRAVIWVFNDLYKKGLIYRGARMINWDPAAKTALSDEEVEYKDLQGKLYYLKYFLTDSEGLPTNEFIAIATQRPETIMGDTAICVNSNDERYASFAGRSALVPLINRKLPIIFDEYVDPGFGTGALKVTPAHDINDYNLGLKHHLDVVDTLNEDGSLSEAAQIYVGEDRFVARRKIILELKDKGFLIKEEEYTSRLGYSQRSGAVVEPRISTQWFVKMKDLAGPALNAVMEGDIKIHPGEKFLATYKYWLENVKDWCISRQLWWGQRVPAWYTPDGAYFVAENKKAAFEKLQAEAPGRYTIGDLRQDEDVLDTWFSSWLWPIQVFKGITQPGNADFEYYYPGSVLVTGQDIIFFWVARMIMAGMHFEKRRPFEHVYFTGMVRDKLGRKMSKSLGNSPDLLELIDKYGADAVRFGILISSPAGNDLLFDESSLEQGRNFNNKIWNALKLIKLWALKQSEVGSRQSAVEEVETNNNGSDASKNFALQWFENRLSEAKTEIENLMLQFKLSEALKTIYSLIWDDFCSWYLEWIKPGFEEPVSQAVYQKTVHYFGQLMQLLHPFMPFITEELYHQLEERQLDLCVTQYAPFLPADPAVLAEAQLLKAVISALRDARNKAQIKPKEAIRLHIDTATPKTYMAISSILAKQVNASELLFTNTPISQSITVVEGSDKFYLETALPMNAEGQKDSLLKELDYLRGFLVSVDKKLSNQRFVENAKPDVVELERRKKADAENKIRTIEESLASL